MGDVASATGAVKGTFSDLMDAVGDYLVPVIGVFVGVGSALLVGGAGVIYGLGQVIDPNIAASFPQWGQFCKLAAGGIYAGIAMGFYHLYNSAAGWGKYVYGFVTGFFAGFAIRFIGAGIANQTITSGFLDDLMASASNLAGGAT